MSRWPLPRVLGALAGATLVGLLCLPLAAMVLSLTPADIARGVSHPAFGAALALTARTTLATLVVTVTLGTPLAWWLARSRSRAARVVDVLVDLPIVVPPAVLGVGLLFAFGQAGPAGPIWQALGWRIPFTTAAVVLAQTVVSAPFYVQAAAAAFRRVDPDLLLVARSLGASPMQALLRVALPLAAPGLVAGASLGWARALGEFGATLLFAGSRAGVTRTMPLATFAALEVDVHLAAVFSLALVALATVGLMALRGSGTRVLRSWRGGPAARRA